MSAKYTICTQMRRSFVNFFHRSSPNFSRIFMANIEEEIATESFPQILTERENRSRDDGF